MKKLLFILLAAGAFSFNASAQEEKASGPEKTLSKEEKEKRKIRQEEDLAIALKETGLTEDQTKQVKEILKEANAKSSELKKSSLSDEEKAAKKEELNTEKNTRLKEIMGAEKFKTYSTIRKKQKMESMAPKDDKAVPKSESGN